MKFDWHPGKAAENLAKHRLSFTAAPAVFADAAVVVVDVSRAEDGEERSKAIGLVEDRLLVVVFTLRLGVYRLISFRPANPTEVRSYADRPIHPRSG